jgi:hypothetical protein
MALEGALDSKRRGDVGQLLQATAGEDLTLELSDGRMIRGFLHSCVGGKVVLDSARAFPMVMVRGVVRHPKTAWQ